MDAIECGVLTHEHCRTLNLDALLDNFTDLENVSF